VLGRANIAGNISLRCTLTGVLLGWHKKEKEVIASRTDALKELMDEFMDLLEDQRLCDGGAH
jgi:hypothetical protein